MGTFFIMRLLACTVGVRVSLAAEMEGLDVSEHGVGESDKVLVGERLYRRRMRWRKRLGMKVPEKEAEDKYGASPGNSTHSGESFGSLLDRRRRRWPGTGGQGDGRDGADSLRWLRPMERWRRQSERY